MGRIFFAVAVLVQAVGGGEDQQLPRADEPRDQRRKPVVVAQLDFVERDRVVFVDDRNDRALK